VSTNSVTGPPAHTYSNKVARSGNESATRGPSGGQARQARDEQRSGMNRVRDVQARDEQARQARDEEVRACKQAHMTCKTSNVDAHIHRQAHRHARTHLDGLEVGGQAVQQALGHQHFGLWPLLQRSGRVQGLPPGGRRGRACCARAAGGAGTEATAVDAGRPIGKGGCAAAGTAAAAVHSRPVGTEGCLSLRVCACVRVSAWGVHMCMGVHTWVYLHVYACVHKRAFLLWVCYVHVRYVCALCMHAV